MLSLGITGAAITGIKYGARRLVNGLARDLFREDSAIYYQDLLKYEVSELQTLDSEFVWLSRLGYDAISPDKLVDELDSDLLNCLRDLLQTTSSKHQSAETISAKPAREKRAVTRTGLRKKKIRVKRSRRAK